MHRDHDGLQSIAAHPTISHAYYIFIYLIWTSAAKGPIDSNVDSWQDFSVQTSKHWHFHLNAYSPGSWLSQCTPLIDMSNGVSTKSKCLRNSLLEKEWRIWLYMTIWVKESCIITLKLNFPIKPHVNLHTTWAISGFKYICFGCQNCGLGVSCSSFRRVSFCLFCHCATC